MVLVEMVLVEKVLSHYNSHSITENKINEIDHGLYRRARNVRGAFGKVVAWYHNSTMR